MRRTRKSDDVVLNQICSPTNMPDVAPVGVINSFGRFLRAVRMGWLVVGVVLTTNLFAVECPDPLLQVDLPKELRDEYDNPDGSCVQCSIGMTGNDQNVLKAERLLEDYDWNGDGKISANEKKVRGGSGPSRVASYARQRGLRIYNITGRDTIDWMLWALRNGRGVAIGFETRHYQTLFGKSGDLTKKEGTWYVCDNNSTHRVDAFDYETFKRKHHESGPWIVILDYPPHPKRPIYEEWWK